MEMYGWRSLTMLRRYAQGLDKRAQDTGRRMEAFMERNQAHPNPVRLSLGTNFNDD